MTKPDEVLGLDPEFFASRLKKRIEAKTHCRVTAFGPSNEKGGPQAARVATAQPLDQCRGRSPGR